MHVNAISLLDFIHRFRRLQTTRTERGHPSVATGCSARCDGHNAEWKNCTFRIGNFLRSHWGRADYNWEQFGVCASYSPLPLTRTEVNWYLRSNLLSFSFSSHHEIVFHFCLLSAKQTLLSCVVFFNFIRPLAVSLKHTLQCWRVLSFVCLFNSFNSMWMTSGLNSERTRQFWREEKRLLLFWFSSRK